MKKQKTPKSAAAVSQDAVTDPRFASFTTDPRFRLPSKKQTRTKIDKRFSRMLKDDDFANTAKVDRYGRKLSNYGKKQALRRLYQPVEDESESEDEEEAEADIEVEDDDVVEKELRRANTGYDAARGGGFSSSEEEEDEDEEGGGVEIENVEEFPALQAEQTAVPMGEVTSRIAVVNLDWDNIRAVDLMAVFSSFVRGSGWIKKISVYPSDFGRERMEREEQEGPPKEVFAIKPKTNEDEDETDSEDISEDEDEDEEDENIKKDLIKEDDGQEFDSAALRQYQLERLRYYYAVMVCSEKETANQIYQATDGTEYLSSANFFDLRFIPDDVEFDEKPRDVCESVPPRYKPTEFVTDALQHSKVKLTWDAEDMERKDVIKRAFTGSRAEIGENDLKAYLGSDSSEDEEEEASGDDNANEPKLTKKELARQKMRAALGLPIESPSATLKLARPAKVGDMEITFTPGLSAIEKGNVFQNEPIIEETTEQAYIRKERERKARRKAKAKALRQGMIPSKDKDASMASVTITTAVAPAKGNSEADDGFDDPLFTTDEKVKQKNNKAALKEARKAKHIIREAEETATASERAKLELLMADDPTATTTGPSAKISHFDINEIARQDKLSRRKRGKKGKKHDIDAEAGAGKQGDRRGMLQEGFKMDVSDPRFSAVFERHEYAIDPSNPKFKATEGMKALLEEGRKKRKVDVDDEGAMEGRSKRKVRSDRQGGIEGGVELLGLVQNLKKKVKLRGQD